VKDESVMSAHDRGFAKFERVAVDFVSADRDPFSVRADVLVRAGEMVLEIDFDGDRQVVVGARDKSGSYAADAQMDGLAVRARWTSLFDEHVGIWSVSGDGWFFRFRFPKPPVAVA
jgi:hypothetical protein